MKKRVKIIECPRDAMQGIKEFISTRKKAAYINQLLQVGFDTIDFGSFVSPKAIPQLKDTAEVLAQLELENSHSKLLAIIANQRGAMEAVKHEKIHYLGYPFSISETFQKRNTNASIEESLCRVEDIQNLCSKHDKQMVIYISMGFGNPYGDPFHEDIVSQWLQKLSDLEISIFALSDTIGVSEPPIISRVFQQAMQEFPELEIGAHFHTTPAKWKEKVAAAYENGCRRFDAAIGGFGGCPMAEDELTGNMPTEKLLEYMEEVGEPKLVDPLAFAAARKMATAIFP
jgi:hydroxymethylglutaryl-CoA lyase